MEYYEEVCADCGNYYPIEKLDREPEEEINECEDEDLICGTCWMKYQLTDHDEYMKGKNE